MFKQLLIETADKYSSTKLPLDADYGPFVYSVAQIVGFFMTMCDLVKYF